MFNRLGNLMVYYDKETKFLHSDSMFSGVLWKDLRGIENKSIQSSIKRYSRFSRKVMESLSEQVDMRYLLGILNSKYAGVLLSNQRGGDYHIYPEHLRNLPVPLATKNQQQSIITLVNQILSAKNANPLADTSKLEKEIDVLVYELYGVTENEENKIEK
jgi:adenine-specific DNA-methyltransferase